MPKWKAQSEQLRVAMRNHRTLTDAAARGVDARAVALEAMPEELDDR
jgi:hypothetical protein